MNKYNIAHINTQDFWGGAAKVAWKLSEIQRRSQNEVKIFCGKKLTDSPESIAIDIQRNEIQKEFLKNEGLLYYDILVNKDLINHEFINRADVIHLHNLHGDYFNPYTLAELKSKHLIWTLHDMQSFTGHCAHSFECTKWQKGCGNCPDLKIYPSITKDSTQKLLDDKKKLYNSLDIDIVVPSLWLKEKVEKSILADKRIHLIYNGIDENVNSFICQNTLFYFLLKP
ncbi:MAG TPA: glycosyltransferase [Candidatus Cloacimonadota bacterium]|nr:glycosyltransferase [Candidatus Cloacimonadota bacterium]